jgi:hypothetical protein
MNRIPALTLGLAAAVFAATTPAQQPVSKAGATLESSPGKATATETIHATVQVVSVDKATRTLTLKPQDGAPFDVVAGDEVKSFDQIKANDVIVVTYKQAITLELAKSGGAPGDVSASQKVVRNPGERPSGGISREVKATAEVIALDPKASTITLKGPSGKQVTLDVRNPDQFKVVKVGDRIDVTYTEAVALNLEPAPKAAAPKTK